MPALVNRCIQKTTFSNPYVQNYPTFRSTYFWYISRRHFSSQPPYFNPSVRKRSRAFQIIAVSSFGVALFGFQSFFDSTNSFSELKKNYPLGHDTLNSYLLKPIRFFNPLTYLPPNSISNGANNFTNLLEDLSSYKRKFKSRFLGNQSESEVAPNMRHSDSNSTSNYENDKGSEFYNNFKGSSIIPTKTVNFDIEKREEYSDGLVEPLTNYIENEQNISNPFGNFESEYLLNDAAKDSNIIFNPTQSDLVSDEDFERNSLTKPSTSTYDSNGTYEYKDDLVIENSEPSGNLSDIKHISSSETPNSYESSVNSYKFNYSDDITEQSLDSHNESDELENAINFEPSNVIDHQSHSISEIENNQDLNNISHSELSSQYDHSENKNLEFSRSQSQNENKGTNYYKNSNIEPPFDYHLELLSNEQDNFCKTPQPENSTFVHSHNSNSQFENLYVEDSLKQPPFENRKDSQEPSSQISNDQSFESSFSKDLINQESTSHPLDLEDEINQNEKIDLFNSANHDDTNDQQSQKDQYKISKDSEFTRAETSISEPNSSEISPSDSTTQILERIEVLKSSIESLSKLISINQMNEEELNAVFEEEFKMRANEYKANVDKETDEWYKSKSSEFKAEQEKIKQSQMEELKRYKYELDQALLENSLKEQETMLNEITKLHGSADAYAEESTKKIRIYHELKKLNEFLCLLMSVDKKIASGEPVAFHLKEIQKLKSDDPIISSTISSIPKEATDSEQNFLIPNTYMLQKSFDKAISESIFGAFYHPKLSYTNYIVSKVLSKLYKFEKKPIFSSESSSDLKGNSTQQNLDTLSNMAFFVEQGKIFEAVQVSENLHGLTKETLSQWIDNAKLSLKVNLALQILSIHLRFANHYLNNISLQ